MHSDVRGGKGRAVTGRDADRTVPATTVSGAAAATTMKTIASGTELARQSVVLLILRGAGDNCISCHDICDFPGEFKVEGYGFK